jgi:ubiquinone/menaquinone biosynthesis C-methylase UbiE
VDPFADRSRCSLDGLPFESDSFDFVHLRFVGLGIPETAWEGLLDECARVLKPNTGILEVSQRLTSGNDLNVDHSSQQYRVLRSSR